MSPIRTSALASAAASLALITGAASADTVTADFSFDHLVRVHVNSGPTTGDVNTVTFHWTRTDSPGPGVDASIARTFPTFCVELDQGVRPGTGCRFDVRTMQEAGYSEDMQLALRSLWAAHINDLTTDTMSAAFQLAVWELRYDTDRDLGTGTFAADSSGSAASLAQSWLDELSSTTTLRDLPTLRILCNDDSQDQLTEIPEPGAAACALAGMALLRRRRMRK